MLTLAGQAIKLRGFECSDNNVVMRITDTSNRPAGIRAREALFVGAEVPSEGFGAYVTLQANRQLLDALPEGARTVILPDTFEYLAAGDVIRISPRQRRVRTLYRRGSAYNSILLTERCNHYCLMCSQPPKDVNDSWIVDDVLSAIPLMDTGTRNINLTGGEPTLLGQDFLRVVRMAKSYLPNTALHVLSNGRRFADAQFTAQYAAIAHPDIMVGIPLYSDISTRHDYVVQADGAYDETIRGILRLKERGQKVLLSSGT